MASKNLFRSANAKAPTANAVNQAGGKAYAMSDAHALAQYAVTGAFNTTFHASAEAQLEKVLELAKKVDAELVAKTAIYARQRGLMKDMPALLCAMTSHDPVLLAQVFSQVIDDAKMLRLFVQMMRSGVTGRRSLGTRPKKLVEAWLDARTDEEVFFASAGGTPSLLDVLKLAHPRPKTPSRKALYGYLVGAKHEVELLPVVVRAYEDFKAGRTLELPEVPFAMLTALPLSQGDWKQIAKQATWTQTRMNLNTFLRHGVFDAPEMIELVAEKLRDEASIRRTKVFPYQLMTSFHATHGQVPAALSDALQDAMEVAIANVPRLAGEVHVLVDVSGSMSSPITGHRPGATTSTRCVDVAALYAAALLRLNPDVKVMAFEQKVVTKLVLNRRDSVMTNAKALASVGGGGTNCAAPLEALNEQKAKGDLVIYISDNESWIDTRRGPATGVMHAWEKFRARNPHAKLVCIDLVPNATTQAVERADIMNIGGFSDAVFTMVASFYEGRGGAEHWLREIQNVPLAA